MRANALVLSHGIDSRTVRSPISWNRYCCCCALAEHSFTRRCRRVRNRPWILEIADGMQNEFIRHELLSSFSSQITNFGGINCRAIEDTTIAHGKKPKTTAITSFNPWRPSTYAVAVVARIETTARPCLYRCGTRTQVPQFGHRNGILKSITAKGNGLEHEVQINPDCRSVL